ncbi:universal stress protein [Halococcus thailandensis]|uniref:universal stress protein n=1 Tax=Halococcus thailandensis TaxID=335952 RepID=UPI0009B5B856
MFSSHLGSDALSVSHPRPLRQFGVILNYAAENDTDLVVMGTHGQRGIVRFLLGSVAERVLRLSETPVLVVRQQTDADSKIDSDDETSATD